MKEFTKKDIIIATNEYNIFCGSRVLNNSIMAGNIKKFIGSFRRASLKRDIFSDLTFSADLKQCALTDSKFSAVKFKNFNIEKTNLQFCTFYKCKFLSENRKIINGSNFDCSKFSYCKFNNIDFLSCGLSGILFYNCTFTKCNIISSTLESTKFSNCSFTDCNFSSINIEYSTFIDCEYNKLILPVSQAPYIFGFHRLINKSGIFYSNDNSIFDKEIYYDKINSFLPYYYDQNQYFVLVNIFMSKRNFTMAYNYIIQGIKYYKQLNNYKMIKHLCKLATTDKIFTNKEIMDLFELIKDTNNMIIENENDLSEYNSCVFESKCTLLEANYNLSKASIYINTNIEKYDDVNLSNLMNEIDDILITKNVFSKKIEIRHNSPFNLLIEFVQNPEILNTAIESVMTIISSMASIIAIGEFTQKIVNKTKVDDKIKLNNNQKVTVTIIIEN